jgi:hypothetical protein
MTYASQQLSEALQELVREPEVPQDYTNRRLPISIETDGNQFPPAVADFLARTNRYSAETRGVSVGIY